MSAQVIKLDGHPNRLLASQMRGTLELNEHKTAILRAVIRIQRLEGQKAAVQFLESVLGHVRGVCGNE